MDQVDTTIPSLPGPPRPDAGPSTSDESMAGGESPPPRRWPDGSTRPRRWPMIAGAVASVLALAAGVAGSVVSTGTVGIRPGTLNSTEPFIAVDGIEFFPSDGEVLYTTVNVDRLSVFEWLWARYVEDDTDIVDQDLVFQGRSRDEKREDDLQLMQVSKSVATLVALTVLGYDVFDDNGAAIVEVAEDTPASGLLVRGDVVEVADGQPIANAQELVDALTVATSGDSMTLTVEREGAPVDVVIVLGEHPEREGGFLGVSVETRIIEAPLPFDVQIDSGNVGGPSAGLAFTLALLDGLTEGELTGGARVAATGTIDLGGCVGPIGGLPQKVVAARSNGATLFLVPESQLGEIEGVHGIEVVGVSSLDEALTALAEHGGDTSVIPEFTPQCGS